VRVKQGAPKGTTLVGKIALPPKIKCPVAPPDLLAFYFVLLLHKVVISAADFVRVNKGLPKRQRQSEKTFVCSGQNTLPLFQYERSSLLKAALF